MAGEQQVVLPSQVQPAQSAQAPSGAPAVGTPPNQQDLPDDQDSVDFAFEAFDALTGQTQPLQEGVQPAPLEQQQQPQQGQQQQQEGVQQPPVVEVAEPAFRLFPDNPDGTPAVVPFGAPQQQAPAAQPQAQAPQATPAVVPQPQQAQPVPGAPNQQQQPQPGQAPAAAPAAPQDPFEFAANQIAAQEKQFTQALAQQAYAIPQEDFEKFVGGDSQQASMLAARVHVNVMASVMKVLAQQMPVVMNRLLSVHEVNRQAEEQFWGTNKFLDRTNQQHKQAVDMASRAVRQANPSADLQTITRMAGLMAAMSLGIDPAAAMSRVQSAVAQRPQVQTPGRVVRQAPPSHQPVAPAGVPGNNGVMRPNEWDMTAAIWSADDAGAFEGR